MRRGYRQLISVAVFTLAIAIGGWIYHGPSPRGIDAPPDVPSAARMRQSLHLLLGRPALQHSAGTVEGDAYLRRLEVTLKSAVRFQAEATVRRIEIPFDLEHQDWHPNDRLGLLPENTILKNLLVTIPGTIPHLRPILLVTHHDSCPWGPGAGDASSAVVALVEYAGILGQNPPRRTTHFLFTDGEEFGLLGAHALYDHQALPIEDPAFVLNFDARGTTGGIPMFETHDNNAAWVTAIIDDLAKPKITTSLAVMVYRTLPNATDFDVFSQKFGWPGFNFATIGGAHHYHTPHDIPENLSDRTLQHMGDHVASVHQAIDRLTKEQIDALRRQTTLTPRNAIFFDLFGLKVITLDATSQISLAIFAFALTWLPILKQGYKIPFQAMFRFVGTGMLPIIACAILGIIANVTLKLTPYHQLRYTPVDLFAGLLTIGLAVATSILILERMIPKLMPCDNSHELCDSVWMMSSLLALMAAVLVPAGAYLLVLPAFVASLGRTFTGRPSIGAWGGWLTTATLVGPLLVLLVQAIGPWNQPVYAILAALLSIQMAATWHHPTVVAK